MRLVALPTLARTGRKLTFQRRLVTLWAWLMLFPNCGPLPQISHTCAMTTPEKIKAGYVNIDFTRFPAISPILRKRNMSRILAMSDQNRPMRVLRAAGFYLAHLIAA